MKAFVTGGTGHIGSILIQTLLEKGYDVNCLIRETSDLSFLKSLNSNKLFYSIGDISSSESLLECISNSQPDYVFHSAAALGRWGPWKYFHDLNVVGTKNVVEAIEKTSSVKKLIHVSTFAVYGYRNNIDVKEDQFYGSLHNPYSKTKMMTEKYLWNKYNEGKGLPISIIRPPSVFGPNDRRNITEILNLINRRRIILPGKGNQQNSWAYNYDIADLLIKMAEEEKATGEAFNVKTGDMTSRALIEKIIELLDIKPHKPLKVPIWLTYLAGMFGSIYGTALRKKEGPLIHRQIVRMAIHHHTCNIDKAKQILGWSPRFSIEEALYKTINWFKESQALNNPSFAI